MLRFRDWNHIDASINLVLRSALVILRSACPTWGARLEGLRVSKDRHKRDRARGHPSRRSARKAARRAPQDEVFETAHRLMCRSRVNPRSVRLLIRMRSVGLSSIRPIRLVSWNRSTSLLRSAAHGAQLRTEAKYRSHPGKLSFGSGGVGASHHLYGELFKSLTGIQITHVPIRGLCRR